MRESLYSAHQSLVDQAERREALRRAMLRRPSVARCSEVLPPARNPWGRAFTVVFILVALAALVVVGLDVFYWRP